MNDDYIVEWCLNLYILGFYMYLLISLQLIKTFSCIENSECIDCVKLPNSCSSLHVWKN